MLKERVFRTIEEFHMLEGVHTVVVGFSGGADSVCLLEMLCEYRKICPIRIEAVHVHHGIRKTADRDERFAEEFCAGASVGFRVYREDIPERAAKLGISEEEAGRERRYEIFREVLQNLPDADDGKKGVIAVAHHADDRAETMLFHLFRGAGLKGLAGIEPVNGDIIRPLLYVTRSEIESYLNERNIGFVTDETNLSDSYTRNRIRHHILSYAKEKINPNSVKNMERAAQMLLEADTYIEKEAQKAEKEALIRNEEGPVYDTERLLSMEPVLAKRILYRMITEAAGRKKDITQEHVNAVYMLLRGNGSASVDLPYGMRAQKIYRELRVTEKDSVKNVPEYTVNSRILRDFDKDKIPTGLYTKWFDYDKICEAFTVRTRRPGDYITINRDLCRQSLKDYLINEKIPADLRENIPLLADGSHIMWVVGHRISEYYKVTQQTVQVLEVTVTEDRHGGKDQCSYFGGGSRQEDPGTR